ERSCVITVAGAVLLFFSSRRRHTRSKRDWSADVCSSDLDENELLPTGALINLADQNGAITTIDKWVFTTALDWLSQHRAELTHRSEERRVGKAGRSGGARTRLVRKLEGAGGETGLGHEDG